MRAICIGDLHIDYDPVRNKKVRDSLDQIVSDLEKNPTDVVMIPGDLYHRRQKLPYYHSINDEGLGIKTVQEYLTKISKLVGCILIVRGNAAHDEKGSIEMLHQMESNIYAYENPVLLALYDEGDNISVTDLLRSEPDLIDEMAEAKKQPIGLFPLLPYPTKELLARDVSIDQSNQEFNALFDGLMGLIGIINDKFKCPKILGIHANLLGARLSNGQSLLGQDIIIAPVSLRKGNCDFYNCNHIHLFQEIEDNIWYTGSSYHISWGETEKKYFVEVITDKERVVSKQKIELVAARPMIEVNAKFTDGKLVYDKNIPKNAEVRFKFDVPENETSLLSEAMFEEVKSICGDDVRIDKNVIPVQRESRSEKIMEVNGLPEEFMEYAKVIGETVSEVKTFDENGEKVEKEVLKSSFAKKLALIESDEVEI